MPNENKKTDVSKDNAPEKIDYTLETMESDLKNEVNSTSSFDFSQKENLSSETKEAKGKEELKKETVPKKKAFSPFLKDINKPTPTNFYVGPLEKKEKSEIQPQEEKLTIKLKPESTKKTIPEFKNKIAPNIPSPVIKLPPKKQPLLKNSIKKTSSINNPLLMSLLFVSLIAVCAGIYYFYFINKKPSVVEPPTKNQPLPEPNIKTIPEKLKNSQLLQFNSEKKALTLLLTDQKTTLEANSGFYYKIENNNSTLLSSELLSSLEIQFPEEVLSTLDSAWIFLYSQEDILKMNLILEIKGSSTVISDFLTNNEYRLPEILKPLFIDESFVLNNKSIAFEDSRIVENIRYYNFTKGIFNKAIDWGITSDNYLILSTSRETALKITEDLKIK